MQAALHKIRRDLRNPISWDDLNNPPAIIVILEVRHNQIQMRIFSGLKPFPFFRLFGSGRDCVVFTDDINSPPVRVQGDVVIGLIPAKNAMTTYTVLVTVQSWFLTLVSNQWTLQVAPGDTLVPIFHGCTLFPLGGPTDVTLEVLEVLSGETQHRPRVVSAFCSDNVRREMSIAFGNGPLHPELLPDLRYNGPLDFGVLIEKELIEAFWHPTRVAKNMSLLDMK